MTVAEPETVTYTQMLSKGGAMLTETRTLLSAWRPGQAETELAEQALREDLLGQATADRVGNIVSVFAMRYLRPDAAPAYHLKRILAGGTAPQVYTDLVFHYTAKRDGLLREFTLRRYWPAVREGRLILTNRDAEEFIREGELAGRTATVWSD